MPELLQTLLCPACKRQRLVGCSEKLTLLRDAGKLRRAKNPDPDLIRELFTSLLPSLACDRCDRAGLQLQAAVDEDDPELWGESRRCEVCQQPIMPERLDVFPDAQRCAACQDKPNPETADDFCPRCGDRLRVATSTRGITRYRTVCPTCG